MFDRKAYQDFIASKGVRAEAVGFAPAALPGRLFDHQRSAVEFALGKGRAALFLDTGLGKSGCEAVFADEAARETGKPSLILTPLAVARQMQRECEAFGVSAQVIREDAEIDGAAPVVIANYERLAKLDVSRFGAVVLDECFAPGTPVSVINQSGNVSQEHIETIQVGDRILNAAGIDRVSDVHRREVPHAIRVTIGGSVFICSPNHPIFTQRGWTAAQFLQPGDKALGTGTAVRLVRGSIFPEVSGAASWKILRSVLLSEMADDTAGCSGESSLTGGGCEAWSETLCMVEVGQPEGGDGDSEDHRPKPSNAPGCSIKNLPPIEGHEARTFRAWGQWPWNDGASGVHEGCSWRRLDSGICFVTGPTDTGLSDALQDGFSASGVENLHRGGWSIPQQQAGSGREEDRETGFTRVDSLEVLKPGHPDLERYRDASGKLYFYDLGGTRHPSFTVCGYLVHNSSILKSFAGATKRALVEAFASTPYRLAATATPAPNDHMEIGQHAEFLGVMPGSEMLTRWFIADQTTMGGYRLKGHGTGDFWAWVASWARAASLPSDLEGDDAGFILPALRTHLHVCTVDLITGAGDGLFRLPDNSATSIHGEKKATLAERVRLAAEIANGHEGHAIVWCERDDESAALTAAIPDAVEVKGSMPLDAKEAALDSFATGAVRVMVSKPKLAGFGLNLQHAHCQVFASISHSYESYYQAVRRSWRFGQTREVDAHIVIAETETGIWRNIQRKSADHDRMKLAMTRAMSGAQVSDAVLRRKYARKTKLTLPKFMQESGYEA